jgi:hypothetical protein
VLFEESSAGGAPSACAAATTVGDTHLGTYNGLAYDFQAAGDFVLSETDPDFVVQNRQVSGAPTWPNAAVNHGIATRMGRTSVALCMPAEGDNLAVLFVDEQATPLASGHSIVAPGGVQIWRAGDQYTVTSASGDSVRAQANAIGESWRVPADASLLAVCGGRTEVANPAAPFYAGNLDPSLRAHGQAVCTAAGVKPGPLLENCILDVAVIGGDAAASVFVGARAPVADGKIAADNGTTAAPGEGGAWWPILVLLLLLLLLLLALVVWFLRRA